MHWTESSARSTGLRQGGHCARIQTDLRQNGRIGIAPEEGIYRYAFEELSGPGRDFLISEAGKVILMAIGSDDVEDDPEILGYLIGIIHFDSMVV